MFWNNIKIALRNLRKHKVFAAINILGLALGMTIYVLAGLIAKYEDTHDAFFANSHRTYTLGINASPGLNVGIDKLNVHDFGASGSEFETTAQTTAATGGAATG